MGKQLRLSMLVGTGVSACGFEATRYRKRQVYLGTLDEQTRVRLVSQFLADRGYPPDLLREHLATSAVKIAISLTLGFPGLLSAGVHAWHELYDQSPGLG